jgi:branched-subunit amino acid transport protein
MTMWMVVVLAGIATFSMRFVFIALFKRIAIPPTLERGLRYVAPAVLAAITLPALIAPGNVWDPVNPFLPAAILGGIATWWTKSIGAAIAVGLPALWVINWIA